MKNFFELFLILIFLCPNVSSSMDIYDSSLPNSTHIIVINKLMVEMLTKCYGDVELIIIHTDSDQSTIKSIRDIGYFSIILSDDSSVNNNDKKQLTRTHSFLITTKSETHLQDILLNLKNTPWWNIMRPFFILDKSPEGYINSENILKTAWKMNLIKSFFLCVDSNQQPMVFTYNPYTNYAPQPWKQVLNSAKQSDHWTMYTQSNRTGINCESLNFDRTKYLNGTVIRIITTVESNHWIPGKEYDESILEKIHPYNSEIVKTMKRALNVTFIFNIAEAAYNISKEPQGYFKYLLNGSSDIAICLRTRQTIYNLTPTFPVLYSSFRIATNHRGFYTPWEKIKNYYGMITLVSMSIILTMTFIVIVSMGKKRRWAFAGFEILRLLTSASLHSRIHTLSLRIFFGVILLYCLIMHATFEGHLAAFLTKDEYRSNVEKLEDLRDMRYTEIHTYVGVVPLITDPLLKKKLIVGHPNCTSKILGKDSAACITDIAFLLRETFDNKLHMSKKPISKNSYVYIIRDDWPLRERVDMFLMKLEQSGISRDWYNRAYEQELVRQKRITAQLEVHGRAISLSMLDIFFIIWAIGITLATISFVFEIGIVNQFKKIIRKICTYLRVAITRR